MKYWMKVLMWLGLGGGIGYFGGFRMGSSKAGAEGREREEELTQRLGKEREKYMWLNLQYSCNTEELCSLIDLCQKHNLDGEALKIIHEIEKRYSGQSRIGYDANAETEKTEEVRKEYAGDTSVEEEERALAEKPAIGDEADIETSPAIEFISEQEYYDNPSGYAQEELIWYELDEVLWDKDTQTKMSEEEGRKAIGIGTLEMFDIGPLNQTPPDSLFIKNHILMNLFRVDRMDAAWCDEHGENSEEEE